MSFAGLSEAILDSLSEGGFTVGADWRITSFNRANIALFCRRLGWHSGRFERRVLIVATVGEASNATSCRIRDNILDF